MIKNQNKNRKILKALGLNIRFFRQKKKLTQEQIADSLNAERSYIAALECGTKSPSLYFLYELSRILDIPLRELADIDIE